MDILDLKNLNGVCLSMRIHVSCKLNYIIIYLQWFKEILIIPVLAVNYGIINVYL